MAEAPVPKDILPIVHQLSLVVKIPMNWFFFLSTMFFYWRCLAGMDYCFVPSTPANIPASDPSDPKLITQMEVTNFTPLNRSRIKFSAKGHNRKNIGSGYIHIQFQRASEIHSVCWGHVTIYSARQKEATSLKSIQ